MSGREIFAKVSGSLDSNRKIRRAGRDGRDVFLWVLRQVALRNSDGSIPVEDVTDFVYLAEQLMCSVEQAEDGYRRAIDAGLIEVTDGVTGLCAIVGWDDEWSRRAMTGTERQARFKAKKRKLNGNLGDSSIEVTEPSLPAVTCNVSVSGNAVEKRREEKKRERGVTAPLALELGEPSQPKAPDIVDRLWAEQESQRAALGGRPLTLTKDRRKLITAAVKAGYTAEDLSAATRAYADEARSSGSLEWFNGETNWRPANVARKLGGISTIARPAPGDHPLRVPTIRRKFL